MINKLFLCLIIVLVVYLTSGKSFVLRNNTNALSNEYLLVEFDSTTGTLLSISYHSQIILINNETTQIFINNTFISCSKLLNITENLASISYTYSCTDSIDSQLIITYRLESQWRFFQKQIYYSNNQNRTIETISTSLTFTKPDISSFLLVKNQQDLNKEHSIFLRTSSSKLGIYCTWQHPFGIYQISIDNRTVSSSYKLGIDRSYSSEGFLIGFYELSDYEYENQINYAERQAYENATTFFYPVPQRQRSIKHAVGWDSNDYQIDISTDEGLDEYRRLIDRCAQLGIQSITFAPSNTNVSRRDQSTDDWGWESVLWLSLGEKIRLEQWKPFRDPLPITIQRMLDYAALKQVKLVPYVYPPLGYRSAGQDSAWLYPSSHCHDYCATLASVEFQEYLLQLLTDFAQVTGIGGYAWDYNFFYDSSHTEYAQWRGWQMVRINLLKNLPYLIMDHRYASQYDGPWSWITLNGYTSPLLSDENPETYPILYPSIHTDKIAADFMRQGNVELRLYHFASMDAIPGFIGHQNERIASDGSVPWTDHNQRDFDFMGFPYSLLSNIATAGLNLIHTSLPARDEEEFHLLPATFVQFWSYWLAWTDEHQQEIRNAIPFNSNHDWVLMQSNGFNGFIFLFNPNYLQSKRSITFDGNLNIVNPPAQGFWLLREIYPQNRIISSIVYNQTVETVLDGQSATVYELSFITNIQQPILIGISGQCYLINDEILVIDGVFGEAGTQTIDPVSILLPSNVSVSMILLNGREKKFQQENERITLTEPIIFAGIYLPRAAQIQNNTILVSDLLLKQLADRKLEYPIQWTDEELKQAVWLAPHRLILFICILNADDTWNLQAQINNVTVEVQKAYNTRDHIDSQRFMGFYVDLTNIVTDAYVPYYLHLDMPSIDKSQFIGLFLENIERIFIEL